MKFFKKNFPWKLKKILNGYWNVPAIQQHSVGLNVHWKVTKQCLKFGFQWTLREHSVDIQKCFSWLKGEFSSCETHWSISSKLVQIILRWREFKLIYTCTIINAHLAMYLTERSYTTSRINTVIAKCNMFTEIQSERKVTVVRRLNILQN